MRFLASAKEARGGIEGIIGKQSSLIVDMGVTEEHRNDFINDLRNEVSGWRNDNPPYKGTSNVTRRLLEIFQLNVMRKVLLCQTGAPQQINHRPRKMLERFPGNLSSLFRREPGAERDLEIA